jgi:dTDP-4-dehydrorhamnose reductase
MDTILILGAQGNLGCQLKKIIPSHIAWSRGDADLTNPQEAREKILALQGHISGIINCVAYNDVDGAESNTILARSLNTELPRTLAHIANELDIPLLHYSTGYVFSGNKRSYNELDTPNPISVYGQSKADGEQAVAEIAKKYYIIRTNLLFGPKGASEASKRSVVDTMYTVGLAQHHLKGITDEYSSFTYTPDLAKASYELLAEKAQSGMYHIINEGSGSWYGLAVEIFTQLGWDITEIPLAEPKDRLIAIEKVTSDAFTRPAKRPKHAVLENTKLKKLRTWQEALKDYLTTL